MNSTDSSALYAGQDTGMQEAYVGVAQLCFPFDMLDLTCAMHDQ